MFVAFGMFLVLSACADAAESVTSASPVTYAAALNGVNERPRPNTSPATGAAVFVVTGQTAAYSVTATGLVGTLLVGHIHLGDGNASGPVLVPFSILAQSGTVASGSIALGGAVTQGNITISGDSLRALFENGQAYVNLYTSAFPDGEIRGQITRQ